MLSRSLGRDVLCLGIAWLLLMLPFPIDAAKRADALLNSLDRNGDGRLSQ